MIRFEFSDGGRQAAGFRGLAGDCVVRAIAIATERPYRQVYDELFALQRERKPRGGRSASPREGVGRKVYQPYLESLGWVWVPTMTVGSGCQVHLREDELPGGRIIVRLSRHVAAVVDRVLMDTYDCSREGSRCVYGFFKKGDSDG